MMDDYLKDYQYQAWFFGKQLVLNQLMEECSELIQVSSKLKRLMYGDVSLNVDYASYESVFDKLENDIKEEIADVELMIKKVMEIFRISQEEVDNLIDSKIERTQKLIEKGLEGHKI